MHDVNAFERQVADEAARLAGPSEPVDDAAIFTAVTAITATPSPKRGFQSVVGATKFVVAGVIVALFGGFLLTVTLTTPRGDDVAPAAVSPSPMTTEELLSGMATEEVEPGTVRVLDDGAGHDLAAMHLGGVWAGGDGSMWVLEQQVVDQHFWGGYRLLSPGRPGDTPIDIGDTYWFDMAVDADGTVWAKTGSDQRIGALATNDGITMPWRTREYQTDHAEVRAMEAGPDGSIWITRDVQNAAGPWVARHDGSGWSILPPSDDPELQGDYAGDGPDVDVGPDGTVWIANGSRREDPGRGPHGVLRFDGTAWVLETPASEPTDLHAGPLAVGLNGTAWVYLYSRQEDLPDGLRHILARWSDGEWATYGLSEGIMGLPSGGDGGLTRLSVDHAGTLWIAFEGGGGPILSFAQRAAGLQDPTPAEGPCPGVLSFDGTSWRQYLRGRCVNHVAVAPDGSIWASAATHPDSTDLDIDGLYVITPEAVAAAESDEPDVEDDGSSASLPPHDSLIELEADAALGFTAADGTPVSAISVVPGKTLLIRVDNTTGFEHSFFIGTEDQLSDPEASTDVGIEPWTSGVRELMWTVPEDPSGLVFGCTVPGHFPLMQGELVLATASS